MGHAEARHHPILEVVNPPETRLASCLHRNHITVAFTCRDRPCTARVPARDAVPSDVSPYQRSDMQLPAHDCIGLVEGNLEMDLSVILAARLERCRAGCPAPRLGS